ncbi:SCO family protein [Ramlibacter alkalitolerans]|uniref:SCO family protein n=1 Tax=Ramlibacter alkalitolerans TaxID=2039631 RepID=A0ABS1JLV4_9BURK|nr:SCO family protein [Ramlibacter alkalitolerans]MBL0425203.1 SCO family protein [Ramlibacter alkalitolerans]
MLRTAVVCAALVSAACAGAARLTHGFQVWTEEGARRIEVALAPVPAPAVSVQGPGLAAGELRGLLANGRDISVVEFVYTHCETLCLAGGTVFQQMQAALQARATPPHVQLVSISFDPERDDPARLATYAERMAADARWWRFVRVPTATQTRTLLDAFRVVVVPDGRDFQHNAALLVVDREGRLLRIFDFAEQQLALDYALHLAEGGKP